MKLLNFTSLRYLMFAALLLLVSIPVFNVVLNKIFTKSIDKDLYLQAKEIPLQIGVIKSDRDLQLWRALDKDLEIISADSVSFRKGPFTEKRKISNGKEESFRILQRKLHILGKDYIVQIESSVLEKDELIRTILIIQLGLLLILLSGAVGINYFINKKVWKPFYKSLSFLKHFNVEGSIGEVQNDSEIKEFRQLHQSVVQLTNSVRGAFMSQKEFIENASHELQTPLARLKFKLELLSQGKDVSQNQHILIGEMHKAIEQLDALNKNLLLLSKIDNGQFESTDPLNVISNIHESIGEVSFIASAKSQQIIAEHSQDEPVIRCNKILFNVLVKNLLINAIQYSPANAVINVWVDKDVLWISNPGEPLPFGRDKLFKRFNKNDRQKGNGLGLAIVKAIASRYDYELSYDYQNGIHRFFVRWAAGTV